MKFINTYTSLIQSPLYLSPSLTYPFPLTPQLFFGSAKCLQIQAFCLFCLLAIFVQVGNLQYKSSMLLQERLQNIAYRLCKHCRHGITLLTTLLPSIGYCVM